ncbi:hypothetical protein [Frondihabitans australicus]|uniref:Uncharacterized protein n=1 Tax=Frondihabitans australicus TaxID=386892 RepID=A0A495II28_9MICO|nr:hypothetical protein [Frondihabitans australicus]RKR75634.1 hypothetical protein C8E83_2782 [Frondihabitans australicus]
MVLIGGQALTDEALEEHDDFMRILEIGVEQLEMRAREAREPYPMDAQMVRWRKKVAEWHEELRVRGVGYRGVIPRDAH